MSVRRRFIALAVTLELTTLCGLPQPAFANVAANAELADMSLDELANIRVTSVSKRAESIANAPASIFVITGEEIRRAGITTLPEAMRLAPNLQVARVDARNYAITARGFNNVFSNKLLVLIDGRIVYTPLFSGVFWDVQDVILEDVERIEVISGPGSTLWGSNAVNGVINVITRAASGTQGTLLSAGGSKNERQGAFRYGGALTNGGHYRVYGKYVEADDTQTAAGASTQTGWKRRQTGFRLDLGNAANGMSFHGDAYDGKLNQAGTRDIEVTGANLGMRLNRSLAQNSDLSLQAYWDFTERDQPGSFVEHLNTFDIEARHAIQFGQQHNVVWGGGYRKAFDRLRPDVGFAFLPSKLNLHWANIFAQYEVELTPSFKLTSGLRLEDNHYTGLETLPTLRFAWKAAEKSVIWGAASRAVRTPSRFDRDLFSLPPISPTLRLFTGGEFDSEVAKVLELGFRSQPSSVLNYAVTAFYSRYERLRTYEPGALGLNIHFENRAAGRSKGLEMWGSWQAAPAWRLSVGGVVQQVTRDLDPGSMDLTRVFGLNTNDPRHYWMLRSSYDIASDKELDLTLRRVGSLPDPNVPSYSELNGRLAWKVRPDFEVSLIGQNLLGGTHPEFAAAPGRSVYDRSLFLKLLWRQ